MEPDTLPLALSQGISGTVEVVVSLDAARRQAAGYDAPLERELERLLIHGILHLCGHDHLVPGERRAMEREERRLAEGIGMPWPYPSTGLGASSEEAVSR